MPLSLRANKGRCKIANRFWVGGTNSWNGTAGTKWSTTSGGSGGAAVPTSSDDVFFDANSGTCTVTISTVTANCLNLNCSGGSGVTITQNSQINIFGSLNSSGLSTWTKGAIINFAATSTGFTVDLSKVVENSSGAVNFNGSGGEWTLTADIGSASNIFAQVTIINGTLTQNTKSIYTNFLNFSGGTKTFVTNGPMYLYSTGTVFNFGTSQLNGTVTSSSGSVIYVMDTSVVKKTVTLGPFTWYDCYVYGAVGNATVTLAGASDSTAFNSITLEPDTSIVFTANQTYTLTVRPAWYGTSGHNIIITSSGSAAATLSCATDFGDCDYLTLSKNTAAGRTPFYAGPNSTDGGTNTNWIFKFPPRPGIMNAAITAPRPPPKQHSQWDDTASLFQALTPSPTPEPVTDFVPFLSPASRPEYILWQPPAQLVEVSAVPTEPVWASFLNQDTQQNHPPYWHPAYSSPDTFQASTDPVWVAFLIQDSIPKTAPLQHFLSTVAFPLTLGGIKTFDGSEWIARRMQYWDGITWSEKPVYYWDGSQWTITPY